MKVQKSCGYPDLSIHLLGLSELVMTVQLECFVVDVHVLLEYFNETHGLQ